jgi:hypothetical protein
MNYRNIALCAVSLSAALLVTTIRAAEKPKYLFWASAQMADLDKKLTSSMDATKGSSVDMTPTDHRFFVVTHREGNSPTGEVHQKLFEYRGRLHRKHCRDRDAPAHTPIIASRCFSHTRIDGGK